MNPAVPKYEQERRLAFLVMVIALSLLALLTTLVLNGQTGGFDQKVLTFFAGLREPAFDAFFLAVTWLGSFSLLGPGVLLTVLRLWIWRRRSAAWLIGMVFFAAWLTTWGLKLWVARSRPDLFHGPLATVPANLSFPSGHTTHAVAVALCTWLLVRLLYPRWQLAAAMTLGSLAVLVGVSRLYLQVHFPSDVLAGALVALIWAGAMSALITRRYSNEE